MDNATLQHLAKGQIADLTWEAPPDFATEHGTDSPGWAVSPGTDQWLSVRRISKTLGPLVGDDGADDGHGAVRPHQHRRSLR